MLITDRGVSATSYGGGIVSVLSALTLTDWGILVGIITAILTFALNVWYKHKQHKREEELHRLRLLALKNRIEDDDAKAAN